MKARALSIALLGLMSGAPALAEEPMRLDYEVYVGGVHALSVETKASNGAGDYRIEVGLRTRGVVGWFGDWTGRGFAEGRAESADVRPREHRFEATWRGAPRVTALAYGDDGSVASTVEPPPTNENRDPVPGELTRGTIDQFSAMIGLVRAVGRTERCAGAWKVFDGRRRYDVSLSDVGRVTMEKSSYNAYAGPALRCRASTNRIAGFRKDDRGPEGRPTDLWIAKAGPNATWIPVRAETETALGALVVHLRPAE